MQFCPVAVRFLPVEKMMALAHGIRPSTDALSPKATMKHGAVANASGSACDVALLHDFSRHPFLPSILFPISCFERTAESI
jgi:hypothetical protein